MQEHSKFRRGLAKVKVWLCSHVCLFIVVDVWVENYIDGDKELRQIGERFTFQPREKVWKEAIDMHVHASEASRDDVDDARCKGDVDEILEICGGLRFALNGAGTSVRYMRERWEGEVSESWGAYLSRMKSRNIIRGESPSD